MRSVLTIIAAMMLGLTLQTEGADVTVSAGVDRNEIFLGETITFQVQIDGSDQVSAPPDMTVIQDFAVQDAGSRANNSRQVTIINGQMTQVEHTGYVYAYALTPKKPGSLTIPPVRLTVAGQTYSTQGTTINVRAPGESPDFKIRMMVSQPKCYVGEQVVLTVTVYLGGSVRNINFGVPVLEDPRFAFGDIPEADIPQGQRYIIPLPGGEAVGVAGNERLGDKNYGTITFAKILVPRQAGTIEISSATAVCESLVGYRESQNPFDSMFGGGRQGVYNRVPIASPPLLLEVQELPTAGRPAGFAGHVGKYELEASAEPAEVNVGDPITLTVRVGGPASLESVRLPNLNEQPALSRDFKIPAEMAPGTIEGKKKVFKQTIRAMRPDVQSIPAIELPYFNTARGEYAVAVSRPIAIKVRETRVVRAMDAEGRDLAPAGSALEAWGRGIAHNYEGRGVLSNQRYDPVTWMSSPLWLAVLIVPPLCWLVMFVPVMVGRSRKADPAALRARKAYSTFRRALAGAGRKDGDSARCAAVLEALRGYLGDRLTLPAAALSYGDVEVWLKEAGVEPSEMNDMKRLFDRCEAGSYAGQSLLPSPNDEGAVDDVTGACRKTVSAVEAKLKKRR